jgi:hypothetical protein
VILCTDGDFNVGETDTDALVRLVRERADADFRFAAASRGEDADGRRAEFVGLTGRARSLQQAQTRAD